MRFLRQGQTYSAKADPIAKLMLGFMNSVAEFERFIIKERQTERNSPSESSQGVQGPGEGAYRDPGRPSAKVGCRWSTRGGGRLPARYRADHLVQISSPHVEEPPRDEALGGQSQLSDLVSMRQQSAKRGEGDLKLGRCSFHS